jgi:hypothetical protein
MPWGPPRAEGKQSRTSAKSRLRKPSFPMQTPQSLVQHVSRVQAVRDRHVKIKIPKTRVGSLRPAGAYSLLIVGYQARRCKRDEGAQIVVAGRVAGRVAWPLSGVILPGDTSKPSRDARPPSDQGAFHRGAGPQRIIARESRASRPRARSGDACRPLLGTGERALRITKAWAGV